MTVLIYDGECSMCSRFIRFIVHINKNPDLRITDFNSNWTKNNYHFNSEIDSVVFLVNEKQYHYSDATIHLLATTNCFFKPLLLCKIIPKKIRDGVYKFIAKRRRKILKHQCPVMDQKMKELFLP
ncbi:thiol-disulfide oxidoreductase DCC family protein [Fervidibacillus albus]|uniref:DUF393 domain-containing protein n=1 Tax=Fervidibacillus albus TaxID=2980026 RepID=A0A9E8LSI7_9BACI|nr:DUF393 domain-containing protein [Fervidibacillus albus]WAA08794.1 DUF393 domain-containing protein [Fervidibacillus albus]